MANKEKMAVWLYPETKELIQKHLESANAKSMSEFIEKAIKFYAGHLDCNTRCATEYLCTALQAMLDGMIKGSEQRTSRLLFKIAVELDKLSQLTAAVNELDDEAMEKLQEMCVQQVRKINGIVNFEDAYKYQKS